MNIGSATLNTYKYLQIIQTFSPIRELISRPRTVVAYATIASLRQSNLTATADIYNKFEDYRSGQVITEIVKNIIDVGGSESDHLVMTVPMSTFQHCWVF